MNLLDRYLKTVRQFLPGSQKDDIVNELADNLRSQIEDQENELGRPLNEAEQEAILKRLGHPAIVASRYAPGRGSVALGRVLIGPILFPLYIRVLAFNLGLTAVACTAVVIALGKPLWASASAVITHIAVQLGIITFIFALTEKYLGSLKEAWDPRDPLAPPPRAKNLRHVPRLESIAQLVAYSIFFFWLTAVGGASGLAAPSGADDVTLGPVWHQIYLPVLLVTLVGIIQACVNLVRPNWKWLREIVRGANDFALIALFGLLLTAGEWVVFANPLAQSEGSIRKLANFNQWIFYNLLICAAVTAIFIGFDLRRLVRAAINRTRPAALAGAMAAIACVAYFCASAQAQDDPQDWAMYNRDVTGTRHNPGEKAIGASNAGQLEEKWRFPAAGSDLEIGVIHATPIVVKGCVYFGTATDPAFYKLSPDGTLRWSYRNPVYVKAQGNTPDAPRNTGARFQTSAQGILGSALVTADLVYFGDIGGWFYALDRESGEERWKLNTRTEPFPDAHVLSAIFSSPILADGKLIVAGGALEQIVAAFPGYKGCTGRGWVMALEPATGTIVWKFNVGPKPEPLDPPITITDSWGKHEFYFGPATSSVWSTPSFDAETSTIFFGTDVNTAPRRPTDDNPRLDTPESCAVIAISVADGAVKWVTQINPGDVWTNAMRSYDPQAGRYKDQSIGDTPKIYTIPVKGEPTKVVGVGCKNGGFYVLKADDGTILAHTPIYTGPPAYPLSPAPDKRTLALPSAIGGLQTGCATDGKTIFTNGIDAVRLASQELAVESGVPPTGGRVVALSLDTKRERWRHERPKVASLGGPPPKAQYKDVGDPVASGIAVANGVVYFTTVASGKLVVLDAAKGEVLKEFDIGPVWSGPSVSRGRVYVGTGNTLFNPYDFEAFFPKKFTGSLYSFGLPGEDEVSRMR